MKDVNTKWKKLGLSLLLMAAVSFVVGQDWAWMKGPDAPNELGVFGMQGMEDPANNPPSMNGAAGLTGADGNLYLFGGFGQDESSYSGFFNDMWKYDVTTNNWTWLKGAATIDQEGTYGVQGVPDDANVPGGRGRVAAWTTDEGKLLFFGGLRNGRWADLWEFDPGTDQWVWLNGPDTTNANGIYGDMGVASDLNNPGGRNAPLYWTDQDGDHWMYGGFGFGETGGTGWLGDMWKYDRSTNQWTWMGGSKEVDQTAVHGTQGMPDPANTPGGKGSAVSWTGTDGHLYLLGGLISGFLRTNDLWRYDIATGNWTWLKGSDMPGAFGVLETFGIPGPNDTPGARNGMAGVADQQGRLWTFLGFSFPIEAGYDGYINDGWMYDPATDLWSFLKGSPDINGETVYGTMGEADPANSPGPAASPTCWIDASNNIWLMGGVNNGNRTSTLWRLSGGILELPNNTNELLQESVRLDVWPNPASDRLYLDLANDQIQGKTIQIVDQLGRMLQGSQASSNELDISGLAPGLYWISLTREGERFVGKFVKR